MRKSLTGLITLVIALLILSPWLIGFFAKAQLIEQAKMANKQSGPMKLKLVSFHHGYLGSDFIFKLVPKGKAQRVPSPLSSMVLAGHINQGPIVTHRDSNGVTRRVLAWYDGTATLTADQAAAGDANIQMLQQLVGTQAPVSINLLHPIFGEQAFDLKTATFDFKPMGIDAQWNGIQIKAVGNKSAGSSHLQIAPIHFSHLGMDISFSGLEATGKYQRKARGQLQQQVNTTAANISVRHNGVVVFGVNDLSTTIDAQLSNDTLALTVKQQIAKVENNLLTVGPINLDVNVKDLLIKPLREFSKKIRELEEKYGDDRDALNRNSFNLAKRKLEKVLRHGLSAEVGDFSMQMGEQGNIKATGKLEVAPIPKDTTFSNLTVLMPYVKYAVHIAVPLQLGQQLMLTQVARETANDPKVKNMTPQERAEFIQKTAMARINGLVAMGLIKLDSTNYYFSMAQPPVNQAPAAAPVAMPVAPGSAPAVATPATP